LCEYIAHSVFVSLWKVSHIFAVSHSPLYNSQESARVSFNVLAVIVGCYCIPPDFITGSIIKWGQKSVQTTRVREAYSNYNSIVTVIACTGRGKRRKNWLIGRMWSMDQVGGMIKQSMFHSLIIVMITSCVSSSSLLPKIRRILRESHLNLYKTSEVRILQLICMFY